MKDEASKKPPKEYREEGATKRSDYADPENWKYPLHKEENVRAALSYFSQPDNYQKYTPEQRKFVAKRIISAAKKYDINTDGFKEKFGLSMEKADEYPSREIRNMDLFGAVNGIRESELSSMDEVEEYFQKAGYEGDPLVEIMNDFSEYIRQVNA